MSPSITIEKLSLQGFRAYLLPQTIELHRGSTPLSLAVFAPNRKGKSSLVDGFEFYFSKEGTLARLGQRSVDSHAGPIALVHTEASKSNVDPSVHFQFREGPDTFNGERRAPNGRATEITDAAKRVRSHTKVPFVIRGYELRQFVEGMKPEQRYEEFATWFGLEPLFAIQRRLRQLHFQIKDKADSKVEEGERLEDLSRLTNDEITAWDEEEILAWLNGKHLAQLPSLVTLSTLSSSDEGYIALARLKAEEDEQLGLSQLNSLLAGLDGLYRHPSESAEGPIGRIVDFQGAIARHAAAVHRESEERSAVGQAIFSDVWQASKKLLETPQGELDTCPLCGTRFSDSPHGSHANVLVALDKGLAELADYGRAEKELTEATAGLNNTRVALQVALTSRISDLSSAGYEVGSIQAFNSAVTEWQNGQEAPDSTLVIQNLDSLRSSMISAKEAIEVQQGDSTYSKALGATDALIQVRRNLERIAQNKECLRTLDAELTRQSSIVGKAIAEYTESLVGTLQNDIETLYSEIQGGPTTVPRIYFSFPGEEERNQQRVHLLMDFAENRKGVLPSGYFSDSQIHTLALSLRLAAIKMFNARVPVIVLDDVVTSYDADHRKTIAGVLARHFADFQIVLVTHDEQFFLLLKDHLPQNQWLFKRIAEVRTGFGPVFTDHQTVDEVIDNLLAAGETAAEEIRLSEEEWLLTICRDFKTSVDIRPVERPYQYDRAELADSLWSFLKARSLTPPTVPGVSNRFLESLKSGVVENLASHFSDNPHRAGSVGDDQARWAEFKTFRDFFVCKACGHRRFKRPQGVQSPLCARCETPFSF